MLVLKFYPAFGIGVFAFAFARQTALPTVGVEHRPSRVPVHLGKVTLDMSEDVFVIFHDVTVGVDDECCHCEFLLDSVFMIAANLIRRLQKDPSHPFGMTPLSE